MAITSLEQALGLEGQFSDLFKKYLGLDYNKVNPDVKSKFINVFKNQANLLGNTHSSQKEAIQDGMTALEDSLKQSPEAAAYSQARSNFLDNFEAQTGGKYDKSVWTDEAKLKAFDEGYASGNPAFDQNILNKVSTEYNDKLTSGAIDAKGNPITEANKPAANVAPTIDTTQTDKMLAGLQTAQSEFANQLKQNDQRFGEAIPGLTNEYQGIIDRQLGQALPQYVRQALETGVQGGQISETGKLAGGFGGEFGKGYAQVQTNAADQVAQFKIALEQELLARQSDTNSQVANLQLGLAQTGAQMGREDYMTQYQNTYNNYLNQLGFNQQQTLNAQGYANQLQSQYAQQGFQANQSQLDRQNQYNMAMLGYQQQQNLLNQQQKSARRGALGQIGGTLIGAGLGGALGSVIPGVGTGIGASLGAGIFGGNTGLTYLGLNSYANKTPAVSTPNSGQASSMNLYSSYQPRIF